MGRYKEYREPRRRGYDDDYTPQDRAAERPPSNSRPSAPQASEPVAAIVKWFNAEKGFGFIAVVGGSEAFMHIRQLEAAGHSSVPEGKQPINKDRSSNSGLSQVCRDAVWICEQLSMIGIPVQQPQPSTRTYAASMRTPFTAQRNR
jgi:cold shock CspA family protein